MQDIVVIEWLMPLLYVLHRIINGMSDVIMLLEIYGFQRFNRVVNSGEC